MFQGCTMVWFYELHYREKNHSNMLCYRPHRNELYTGMLNSEYFLPWTCRSKLSVEWYWLKFFLSQIFLHFGQFYPYSRQVCSKGLDNWTAITDTLTAWNFSSSLKIYFSILPLCRLQLPLRKKHSLSFWHWEKERMLSTICVFKNV